MVWDPGVIWDPHRYELGVPADPQRAAALTVVIWVAPTQHQGVNMGCPHVPIGNTCSPRSSFQAHASRQASHCTEASLTKSAENTRGGAPCAAKAAFCDICGTLQ